MKHLAHFQLTDYLPSLHLFKNQFMLLNTENEAFTSELIAKESTELNVLSTEWTFNSGNSLLGSYSPTQQLRLLNCDTYAYGRII